MLQKTKQQNATLASWATIQHPVRTSTVLAPCRRYQSDVGGAADEIVTLAVVGRVGAAGVLVADVGGAAYEVVAVADGLLPHREGVGKLFYPKLKLDDEKGQGLEEADALPSLASKVIICSLVAIQFSA